MGKGVLWSGDHVFEGIVDTIKLLKARGVCLVLPLTANYQICLQANSPKGKRTVFVTNNSTKSRSAYLKKLSGMGIPSEVEDVFGSAYSAAIYISRILKLPPPKNKVFVLGEAGIETELRTENVPFIGGTDPALRRDIEPADWTKL